MEPGKTVTVKLDWPVRLDRMQQHCGEHILSYAFWKTCGANNVGFHMNEDSVFIDLDQEIDEEKAKKAEWMANECLWANEPVSLHYVDASELGKYPLTEKERKTQGTVRLVDIKTGTSAPAAVPILLYGHGGVHPDHPLRPAQGRQPDRVPLREPGPEGHA